MFLIVSCNFAWEIQDRALGLRDSARVVIDLLRKNSMPDAIKLFTDLKLDAYNLLHRVVLAPMTGLLTTVPGNIPSRMMADLHDQRATQGGLEIVEGVSVSALPRSYYVAASFYHDARVAGR